MAQFKALAPNVQVNGETVLSIVDGCTMKQTAVNILKEKGIENPAPGKWYPQQAWLDAFQDISKKIGFNTLFAIGCKIPENAKFPPEIDSIEKALGAIDIAYHMNHRGGEIGHYAFQKTGERSAKMVCNNPYPCEFDKGIIEAMAKRFKPKNSAIVSVKHDDSAPCRKKGTDSCTYIINW